MVFQNLKYPVRTLIGCMAIMLSILGSVFLVYQSALHGSAWQILSFSIYGISLISLWTMSTLYHTLNVSEGVNRTLEQLDHAIIYFLIAGTYTPICLIVLRGGWGWSLLGINWSLAITGMVLKMVFRNPSKTIVNALFMVYLLMVWLAVFAWVPLTRALPHGGLFFLVLGGIFFTLGTIFFNMRHLKFSPYFGAHEIWHIFVLAGCLSHYWMMLKFI